MFKLAKLPGSSPPCKKHGRGEDMPLMFTWAPLFFFQDQRKEEHQRKKNEGKKIVRLVFAGALLPASYTVDGVTTGYSSSCTFSSAKVNQGFRYSRGTMYPQWCAITYFGSRQFLPKIGKNRRGKPRKRLEALHKRIMFSLNCCSYKVHFYEMKVSRYESYERGRPKSIILNGISRVEASVCTVCLGPSNLLVAISTDRHGICVKPSDLGGYLLSANWTLTGGSKLIYKTDPSLVYRGTNLFLCICWKNQ